MPRSIPAIAEKRTRKIAGMRSSKFVFYEVTNYGTLLLVSITLPSVTRLGDLLDFGKLFKPFGNV